MEAQRANLKGSITSNEITWIRRSLLSRDRCWVFLLCFCKLLLQNDVRLRTEESQYLRESLQRTKDKLEQEKRLNSAIKGKKVGQNITLFAPL